MRKIMPKDRTALEKEIIDEISGINYGGFEGGYAFTSFQANYYEKRIEASEKRIVDDMVIEKQLIAEISKSQPKSDKQTHNEIYMRALALQRKLRGDVSKMYATKDKNLIERKEDELSRYHIGSLFKKILKDERYDLDLKAKVEMMLNDLNIDINNLRI